MYKLTNTSAIVRLEDGATIPASDDNRDYREYQVWLSDGNTPEPADAQSVADLRASYSDKIDNAAGICRGSFITIIPGQEMTYQEKAVEADAFLLASAPTADNYPLVYAGIGITAPDAVGVATVIQEKARSWKVIGSQIERARMKGKMDISTANGEAEMISILDGIAWPEASSG